jgi:hypothetical protein
MAYSIMVTEGADLLPRIPAIPCLLRPAQVQNRQLSTPARGLVNLTKPDQILNEARLLNLAKADTLAGQPVLGRTEVVAADHRLTAA